jgi:hypothetical protein
VEKIGVKFMIRAEFIQKFEASKRISKRLGFWFLFWLAIFAICLWLLAFHGGNISSGSLKFLTLAILIIFNSILLVIAIREERKKRTFGLCCPNCKHDIFGSDAKVVLATGKCGRCGVTILDDAE